MPEYKEQHNREALSEYMKTLKKVEIGKLKVNLEKYKRQARYVQRLTLMLVSVYLVVMVTWLIVNYSLAKPVISWATIRVSDLIIVAVTAVGLAVVNYKMSKAVKRCERSIAEAKVELLDLDKEIYS